MRRLVLPFGVFAGLSVISTVHAHRVNAPAALGSPLVSLDAFRAVVGCVAIGVLAYFARKNFQVLALLAVLADVIVLAAMYPIYSALDGLRWAWHFRGSAFANHLSLHLCLGLVVVILGRSLIRPLGSQKKKLYGNSRFARRSELRSASLLSDSGIYFGREGVNEVRYDGGQHVLGLMPTGAGKTTCFVIPTVLLMNRHSMVISDIKGAEIFQATAGAKAITHAVYRFEPTASVEGPLGTARWNPLDEVPRGDGDVAALQRQAADLVVPSKHGRETHWHRAARELFVLLALEAIYNPSAESSIGSVRAFLGGGTNETSSASDQDKEAGLLKIQAIFTSMLTREHDPGHKNAWRHPQTGLVSKQHPEIISLAERFSKTEARELSSIVSTLATFLQPWADSRIAATTRTSDFTLADLAPDAPSGVPVALYVVVPRHDLARLSPLLRLFYSSLASMLASADRHTDWAAKPEEKQRRTYIFLDEFPMLGYMPVFADMLSTLRGYGATLMILAQDLAQLRNIYGPHEPVTGGCPIFLTAGSQRPETLRHISALAGESTVVWERTSRSKSSGGLFGRRSRSHSEAEARRPLLTTGEVRTLSRRQALLFVPGLHPVRITKVPYYSDPDLRERARIKPPEEAVPHERSRPSDS